MTTRQDSYRWTYLIDILMISGYRDKKKRITIHAKHEKDLEVTFLPVSKALLWSGWLFAESSFSTQTPPCVCGIYLLCVRMWPCCSSFALLLECRAALFWYLASLINILLLLCSLFLLHSLLPSSLWIRVLSMLHHTSLKDWLSGIPLGCSELRLLL